MENHTTGQKILTALGGHGARQYWNPTDDDKIAKHNEVEAIRLRSRIMKDENAKLDIQEQVREQIQNEFMPLFQQQAKQGAERLKVSQNINSALTNLQAGDFDSFASSMMAVYGTESGQWFTQTMFGHTVRNVEKFDPSNPTHMNLFDKAFQSKNQKSWFSLEDRVSDSEGANKKTVATKKDRDTYLNMLKNNRAYIAVDNNGDRHFRTVENITAALSKSGLIPENLLRQTMERAAYLSNLGRYIAGEFTTPPDPKQFPNLYPQNSTEKDSTYNEAMRKRDYGNSLLKASENAAKKGDHETANKFFEMYNRSQGGIPSGYPPQTQTRSVSPKEQEYNNAKNLANFLRGKAQEASDSGNQALADEYNAEADRQEGIALNLAGYKTTPEENNTSTFEQESKNFAAFIGKVNGITELGKHPGYVGLKASTVERLDNERKRILDFNNRITTILNSDNEDLKTETIAQINMAKESITQKASSGVGGRVFEAIQAGVDATLFLEHLSEGTDISTPEGILTAKADFEKRVNNLTDIGGWYFRIWDSFTLDPKDPGYKEDSRNGQLRQKLQAFLTASHNLSGGSSGAKGHDNVADVNPPILASDPKEVTAQVRSAIRQQRNALQFLGGTEKVVLYGKGNQLLDLINLDMLFTNAEKLYKMRQEVELNRRKQEPQVFNLTEEQANEQQKGFDQYYKTGTNSKRLTQ